MKSQTATDTGRTSSFVQAFDALVRAIIVPGSHKRAAEIQMGPQDVRAMIWLGQHGDALMSEFAKGVGVPLSTGTHLVNRLVEKGVVARERSEEDRRIVRVALTSAGRKLDQHFFQQRLTASRKVLAKLNAAEQQTLVHLLNKVAARASFPR